MLTPEGLLDAATKEAELDDFGDESFREPLTIWLNAAGTEGDLSPRGTAMIEATFTRFLVNRLRYQRDLREHPEILEERVDLSPIVITGFPRTGTTKLHRMIAQDPGVQSLTGWQLINPAPFSTPASGGADPRIAFAREQQAMLTQLAPDLMAGHPMVADEADEEILALEMSFEGTVLPRLRARVPTYVGWMQEQPNREPERLLSLLRYVQWQTGLAGPWVLKTPGHVGNLGGLYGVFPNATVVHCHRDLDVAVPSFVRLAGSLRSLSTDALSEPGPARRELAEEVLAMWSEMLSANLRQRAELSDQNIVDVSFRQIVDDPIAVIREIYRVSGRTLSSDAESRMLAWAADNPADKYGTFSYSIDDYGLTEADLSEPFAEYRAHFAAWL